MFRKLLIANRGEIACRIIRSARTMGITTVAVYSAADEQSLHVREADEAFYLGPAPAAESYLNIAAILRIAQTCQADAIHPGYGFLSENADFAQACAQHDIVFIGPPIQALEIMGSKQLAKQQLAHTKIPLIPGYHGADQSDKRLLQEAKKIGFPLLIKAANGGGGKGMRTVDKQSDFMSELAAARRESIAYFADDTMILEKLIQNPRHIEIQIMADNFNQIVHVFERDCSIQRRHQKVIEEAPAAQLSPVLRQEMTDAAIAVAKTIQYRGAGTIECLVENNQNFYFMEMNTRLQVEHPVTEMISGLDLVAWQIKIAANEPLPCAQSDISMQGHAIECRVYAEDPAQEFLPSIGSIRFLKTPHMPHVRIDTGIVEQSPISMYYDPMIAKIIAWGSTRAEAIQRLTSALEQYHVGGVKTNRSFLLGILRNAKFVENDYTTYFLQDQTVVPPKANLALGIAFAVAIDYANLVRDLDPIYQDSFAWQMHMASAWNWRYRCQDHIITVRIEPQSLQAFRLNYPDLDEPACLYTFLCTKDQITLQDGQTHHRCYYEQKNESLSLYLASEPLDIQQVTLQNTLSADHHQPQLIAPMPSTVVAVLKQLGDSVVAGEALIVLEAMKMEHTIRAPHAGTIQDIFYDVGSQVQEGATLAALEPL